MIELAPLLVAWGIQAAGVMSPGPGVALLMGIGMRSGRGPALLATLGIALCAGIYSSLVALGLSALMAEAREILVVIKVLGAAYLAWLAFGAFRKAAQPPPPPEALDVAARRAPWRYVATGFLMQMSNAKAIFFWIAIAAVGGLATANAATLAIFVAGAVVISFSGHGIWAVVLSSSPLRAFYARSRAWVEGTLGAWFAFASFKILTSRI